jgi:hypothetical protein
MAVVAIRNDGAMTGWVARIRGNIGELGLARFLLKSVDRGLQMISAGQARLIVYVLMAQPIVRQPVDPRARGSSTAVVSVLAGDPLLEGLPRPPRVIAERFRTGAQCLIATVKGERAAMLWTARGQYAEDEVRCLYRLPVAPPCVWDFDVHVEPRFRHSRVFARLWSEAASQLVAEGVQWSFSRVSALNVASLAAHGRLGAQPVGHAAFLTLGRLQLSVFTRAPYLHLSASPKRAPSLALAPPR